MFDLVIGGLLLGLIGAPLIFYLIGVIIVKIKENTNQKKTRIMEEEHNKKIKKLKKEYERDQKRFHRLDLKLQRIIAKAKEKEA